MFEGRYNHFFYAGVTKLVGLGILIVVSLISIMYLNYTSMEYMDYLIYRAIYDSLRILIDIVVFVLIALAFNNIIGSYPTSNKANNVRIAAIILSFLLFLDLIFTILMYSLLYSGYLGYVLGAILILTSFPALYVPIMIHGYFNDEDNTTNIKLINKSFLVLGFALCLYYLLYGISLMIQTEAVYAFQSLSSSASSVAYIVFVIAAAGLIIYSRKAQEMSRVTTLSP